MSPQTQTINCQYYSSWNLFELWKRQDPVKFYQWTNVQITHRGLLQHILGLRECQGQHFATLKYIYRSKSKIVKKKNGQHTTLTHWSPSSPLKNAIPEIELENWLIVNKHSQHFWSITIHWNWTLVDKLKIGNTSIPLLVN